MVNSASLAKRSTEFRERSWAVAGSDLIAIAPVCGVALLALIYFSIRVPMSDEVAVLLFQAP
jgi:hypothetical protein